MIEKKLILNKEKILLRIELVISKNFRLYNLIKKYLIECKIRELF
jgi:hypothetical protein